MSCRFMVDVSVEERVYEECKLDITCVCYGS